MRRSRVSVILPGMYSSIRESCWRRGVSWRTIRDEREGKREEDERREDGRR